MKKPRRCEHEFATTGENSIIDWDQYAMELEKYIDQLELERSTFLALSGLCQECGINEAHGEERCVGCANSALPNIDDDLPF